MPPNIVHRYACKLVFGKLFYIMGRELNEFMDEPRIHLGVKHRALYHDGAFALTAMSMLNDVSAYFAVKLHVALDIHPESYKLEDLIKTELERVYTDIFIMDMYLRLVLGTRSFEGMSKAMMAENRANLKKHSKA
ncbi:MAG: hypothetical protein QXT26_06240 [Thermoproteota archaeon]